MISAITWQLLAVLLAAALLGLLIGLSAMQLHQARRQKEAYNSQQGVVDQLTTERDELYSEKASIMQALESEQKLAKRSREKQSHLAAQQETLQAHTNLQAQRLEKLQSELHVSDEKYIRLQRDFASFKANKLREVRMLKVSADEWLDNEELPVLNRKVNQTAAPAATLEAMEQESLEADLDQTQPIIASELDIPSLAESELPDSVEELEFELVDNDEPK